MRLENVGDQTRLGFDICPVSAQKDDARRTISVEEAGEIGRLTVPCNREGEFITDLFERYKRMS